MAKPKKDKTSPPPVDGVDDVIVDDMTNQLIKDMNKSFGSRVAYNLSQDDAPTVVKRWIDTGSVQLNYAIRNLDGGGYPEGRIIEIFGPPSCGKSHLAYAAASIVQSMGGLVVYIDTENATPVQKLHEMGIDVKRRFVYCDSHCTEEVFSLMEQTITKAKSIVDKNIPILVIWDSVAATSPKAELDGEYDENSIGLQARTISKGMRKITGVIGQNNVTLLCLNQIRTAISVQYGDPTTTSGGKAIPFHASVRLSITSGNPIRDKDNNVIGIHAIVTVKKNKVAPPWRKIEFDIVFGRGIVEDEYIFDTVREFCEKNDGVKRMGHLISLSGKSGWRQLHVSNLETGEVIVEKSFYKKDFANIRQDPTLKVYVDALIDAAYVAHYGNASVASDGDGDSE